MNAASQVLAQSGPTLVMRRRSAVGTPPPVCAQAVFEARLLAILDSPIMAIETPTQGFDRKERSLGNAFAELSSTDAAELLDRLDVNYTCDALARKFSKLSEERQIRLLGFLRVCAAIRTA